MAPFDFEMTPTVLLSRRAAFSAGRRLRHPAWDDDKNRAVFGRDFGPHGHDYTLTVAYAGPISDDDGMIVNISDLKPLIAAAIAPLDGRFLDEEVAFFRENRPTAENIARFLWETWPATPGTSRR